MCARDAARSRAGGPGEPDPAFFVRGIAVIVEGLLVDFYTLAGGGILRTVGLLLVVLGILLTFVDIAREPRHRTWRYPT